jgi:hypothetical protein
VSKHASASITGLFPWELQAPVLSNCLLRWSLCRGNCRLHLCPRAGASLVSFPGNCRPNLCPSACIASLLTWGYIYVPLYRGNCRLHLCPRAGASLVSFPGNCRPNLCPSDCIASLFTGGTVGSISVQVLASLVSLLRNGAYLWQSAGIARLITGEQ